MVDLVPGTANRAVREVVDGKEVFTPIVQTAAGPAPTGVATEAKQDDIIALLTQAVGLLEDIKTNTAPTP
nr:hypothetical protein [Alcaligenes faecalis]